MLNSKRRFGLPLRPCLSTHSVPLPSSCRHAASILASLAVFVSALAPPATRSPALRSGPAAVSIDAAAYSPYHGGIINCSGLRGVDHANALVGYGLEPPPAKCASQPANRSFETYCDTAFPLGAGGRDVLSFR